MAMIVEPTRYCLDCSYVLDGLPENRCPECARPFDPRDPTSYSDGKKGKVWRRLSGVAASPFVIIPLLWLCLFLPPLSIVMLPLIVFGVSANSLKKRYVSAAAVLVLTPITFVASQGVVDYARGTARLRFVGLPRVSSFNVDPVYRCQRESLGCLAYGNEWLRVGAYNLVVKTLIRTFGPLRGAYAGPIPSEDQVFAALAEAEPVDLDKLANDRVVFTRQSVTLAPGIGRRLLAFDAMLLLALEDAQIGAWYSESAGGPTATVTDDGVVLVRIPSSRELPDGEESALIVVIDGATGRPFAYFEEGEVGCRFPPVPWP